MRWCALYSLVVFSLFLGCSAEDQAENSAGFEERSVRRAYDGAPPVIPHDPIGIGCTECHATEAKEVKELGIAPANPHAMTLGMSRSSRCTQCHLFKTSTSLWRKSEFEGKAQAYVGGSRQHDLAPPRIPHRVFMRENCLACHAGPASRKELTTSHPYRKNCRQCHLSQTIETEFK